MTISSMTGFGRVQGVTAGLAWAWEVRSVNGRGLDVRLRLPQGFEALEQPVRRLAGGLLARGSVSINLQVQRERTENRYRLNRDWLAIVSDAAREIRRHGGGEEYGLIQAEGLLAVRGVIEALDDSGESLLEEELQTALLAGAQEAMGALVSARQSEGQALHAILSEHFDTIARLAEAARQTAATQPQAILDRLLRSVEAVTGQSPPLPEERIAQEVALLVSKADVREELDRLVAHIASGRALLAGGEPCGRKLEFLAQELHREANTLGSKSQDIELTRIGLDLKAAIDQVREQVANVE